jgi:hypothetical protein
MKQITIELEEDAADALAAKIDDSMPSLEAVARHVLTNASERWEEDAGYRRPCRCQALEYLADDPRTPLVFDTKTNEYHITKDPGDRGGHFIVRYCFFCGGKAPISKRAELFARIPDEEKRRLSELCKEIRTFDEAIRTFGPAEHDLPFGMIQESIDENGRRESIPHRMLTYTGLSDVAEVCFTQRAGDQVSVSFRGKYIGEAAPPISQA